MKDLRTHSSHYNVLIFVYVFISFANIIGLTISQTIPTAN